MRKMKLKYYLSIALVFVAAAACKDELDINENPNNPTNADVELVLPSAIVSTAAVTNQFNSYGAHFGGYMANAGGFSGFGNLLNYNLVPGDYNGMWVNSYQEPLADLRYVINKTEGDPTYAFFNAAAKILTVYNYQRLVDAFGDVPYTEALQAAEGIVAPKYDNAVDIYMDLYEQLDQAIEIIETAEDPGNLTPPTSLKRATDPLFGSMTSTERKSADQMLDWKKFANTLKLRMLMRLSEKAEFNGFVTTGFSNLDMNLGFLNDDAIVDPGYELNRPNPTWNTWGRTTAGALANSSRLPTTFAFGFYSGTKLSDTGRGAASYANYPGTPTNQLGNEVNAPTVISNTVTWSSTDEETPGLGILKGPGMGQPLMLRAEALFLLAEAQARGFITGTIVGDNGVAWDDEQTFYAGIKASFAYIYKDEAENVKDTSGLVAEYRSANASTYLVNYGLAANVEEKQEAIITQKYIAVNMINSDEGWNEYRRTGYPVTTPGGAPARDIASNKSNVTSRPDRLPTRVLYPSSEQSYNAANYKPINYTSDLIFWDPN